MIPFEYHQPDSLDGVIDLLERLEEDAVLLAGGTALLVDMRHGELAPGHVVSLWGAPGLNAIKVNDGMEIGALATVRELIHAVPASYSPYLALAEAGRVLGARQVQNVATVGGNLCKASPGADLVPPLLCLDAQLSLDGPGGERLMPVDGFLTGPDQTALRPAEVLTGIHVPDPGPRTGTTFIKVMRRHAVDCSIVGAAARVTLAEDGRTCTTVRIGLNAVAPNPFRPKGAETLLTGRELTPDLINQAAQQARDESRPVTDVRATADYRRMLVETLVERTLWSALERARQGDTLA